MAGKKDMLLIGEHVTLLTASNTYDGTIVDIVNPQLVKVYWRAPSMTDNQLRFHDPIALERI